VYVDLLKTNQKRYTSSHVCCSKASYIINYAGPIFILKIGALFKRPKKRFLAHVCQWRSRQSQQQSPRFDRSDRDTVRARPGVSCEVGVSPAEERKKERKLANYLAHFLSLHPFDSWPPKQPPRSNLEVTSFFMTFSVTLRGCELIFLNNVPMLSAMIAILFDSSEMTAMSPDFAAQPLCASSYLYSTHFSLICTLYAVSMLPSVSFSDGSLVTVLFLGFAGHTLSAFSSLYTICFSLIYALDTVPRLSSASFFDDSLVTVEQIELQAKLLNYFLGSNKSNINQ